MLILSQCKTKIITLENICIDEVNSYGETETIKTHYRITAYTSKQMFYLGYYNSEKRAKQILEEIFDKAIKYIDWYIMPEN